MKFTRALAIDIGNTKTHGQIRGAQHELLDEWVDLTSHYDSLDEIVGQGIERTARLLGDTPDIIGLGFGGPVDAITGAVKLAFGLPFREALTVERVKAMAGNVPVVHLNDVEASAHALGSPYFEANYTTLTTNPVLEPGPSVLVEIGTGVGTAYRVPGGAVFPSEAHRSHAKSGHPYGFGLSGGYGFARLIARLREEGVAIPAGIQEALGRQAAVGPLVTQLVAAAGDDEFTRAALRTYASYLGEYLGMLQLCFLATTIYIGGSVGRAPGFMEAVTASEAFWEAFSKVDALRGRDMPILRVDDQDATVRGVYVAALRRG